MTIGKTTKHIDRNHLPLESDTDLYKQISPNSSDDPEVLRNELQRDGNLFKLLQEKGFIDKSDPICGQIEEALRDLDAIIAAPRSGDEEIR